MTRLRPRISDAVWLVAVWATSAVWCLTASSKLSAVFDEPIYIEHGLEAWRLGTNDPLLAKGIMPLPPLAVTLPAHVIEVFTGEPIDERKRFGWVLGIARPVTLVYWFLVLMFGMWLGQAFAGPLGGRLATILLACDPNLLGHATLATTDIGTTAMLLGLAWYFWSGRDRGWKRRIALPALWFALAMATKVSGLVFGPIILAVLWTCHFVASFWNVPEGGWTRSRVLRESALRIAGGFRDGAGIALLGGVIGLTFIEGGLGHSPVAGSRVEKWVLLMPEDRNPASPNAVWKTRAELALKSPLYPRALIGIIFQFSHNTTGHGTSFLLGKVRHEPVWYYFPVALAMKLSIPALVLLGIAVIAFPRALLNPMGMVALALFAMTPICRVQIGIRFMFPLMAFTYISLGIVLARGWQAATVPGAISGWWAWLRGPAFRPAMIGGMVAAGFAAAIAWPNGIGFINQAWGGPKRGSALLHDSNVDWGQGLIQLKTWHRHHGQPHLTVWYFGLDPRAHQPPFHCCPVDYLPAKSVEELRRQLGPTMLAVSHNMLISPWGPNKDMVMAWLKTMTPVDRTPTFVIYDLRN